MLAPTSSQEPRPSRSRRLPAWGLPATLLAMSLVLAARYGLRARQDAVVAPRQEHAVGTMVKLTRGKHTTAWYSFAFAGQQYRGSDTVSPSQCFCDVTVYFDPMHPATNALVEYKRKTWADHMTMIFCLWLSAGLAVLLAFVLMLRKPKSKPEPDYPRVS